MFWKFLDKFFPAKQTADNSVFRLRLNDKGYQQAQDLKSRISTVYKREIDWTEFWDAIISQGFMKADEIVSRYEKPKKPKLTIVKEDQ